MSASHWTFQRNKADAQKSDLKVAKKIPLNQLPVVISDDTQQRKQRTKGGVSLVNRIYH
jgi:hypothetical protein